MAAFFRKLMPKRFRKEGVTIPVVRLQGAIVAGGGQFRPALNLATVAPVLDKAFAIKDAPAETGRLPPRSPPAVARPEW